MRITMEVLRLRDVNRRGAAMTETVLVLPIVLVVLALLLMLGRSMARLHSVSIMDRHEAWRQVAHAPGPGTGAGQGQLNDAFLRGEAERIEAQVDGYFPETPRRWRVNAAEQYSGEAGALAEDAMARWPRGRRVRFATTFGSSMPLEGELGLTGPMRHGHVRMENEWKFVNGLRYDSADVRWVPTGPRVSVMGVLGDRYLEALDQRLTVGNEVAEVIRGLYARVPGYGGPMVRVPGE